MPEAGTTTPIFETLLRAPSTHRGRPSADHCGAKPSGRFSCSRNVCSRGAPNDSRSGRHRCRRYGGIAHTILHEAASTATFDTQTIEQWFRDVKVLKAAIRSSRICWKTWAITVIFVGAGRRGDLATGFAHRLAVDAALS